MPAFTLAFGLNPYAVVDLTMLASGTDGLEDRDSESSLLIIVEERYNDEGTQN